MRPPRILAVTASVVALLSLSACGGDDEATNSQDNLVIGVSLAEPGLSVPSANGPVGFDIDVARYVAKELGWSDNEIEFKKVLPADRQAALDSGTVDMIVAAYSITPERAASVDFAGPYLTAGQDLLVKADNSDITGPHSLDGKVLCSPAGTTAAANIKSPQYSSGVTLREMPDNASCVQALLAGEVDAVTTDDVILTGFVSQHPAQLKVLGSPFSTELYGIGLPKGSPDVDVINDVLQQMIDDGTWASDYEDSLDATPPLPPTPGS